MPVTQQRVDDIVDPHSASYFVDQSNGHVYTKPPSIKHPKYVNPYLDVKPAQLTTANLSEHAAHVLPYDERTTTSEMASKTTSETASAATSVEEGLTLVAVKVPLTCGGNAILNVILPPEQTSQQRRTHTLMHAAHATRLTRRRTASIDTSKRLATLYRDVLTTLVAINSTNRGGKGLMEETHGHGYKESLHRLLGGILEGNGGLFVFWWAYCYGFTPWRLGHVLGHMAEALRHVITKPYFSGSTRKTPLCRRAWQRPCRGASDSAL